MLKGNTVAVYKSGTPAYLDVPPFHPHVAYPEALFSDRSDVENPAYEAVRSVFQLAGLDQSNFDTPAWNPLKELVRPGQCVVLKPNMVKETHPRDREGWRYVVTHGSVIRAVADYVFKALEGRGQVVVADAPQTDSSFDKVAGLLGLPQLRAFYAAKNLHFEYVDLRREEWVNSGGVIVSRRNLAGDPRGSVAFDLAGASEFAGHRGEGRYYGADYDVGELNSHHSRGKHEYLIAGTVVKCDVLFSLPKLKTHKKAGITVSLKNLVGVNADKNWLPHHTEGNPTTGGDEHPVPASKHNLERKLVGIARNVSRALPYVGPRLHKVARSAGAKVFGDTEEVVRSGNWFGNDTIWRMCLDLNKVVAYGNSDGTLRPAVPGERKPHYVLVDGIIAGEGRGPMNPDPVGAGLVLFGTNSPSVDAACGYLMGFDPAKIPIVRQAFECKQYRLAEWGWRDVEIVSNVEPWNRALPAISSGSTFHFKAHFGWVQNIERTS